MSVCSEELKLLAALDDNAWPKRLVVGEQKLGDASRVALEVVHPLDWLTSCRVAAVEVQRIAAVAVLAASIVPLPHRPPWHTPPTGLPTARAWAGSAVAVLVKR